MNETDLLADCLRRLNRSEVTYYLTGSMASNYWGIPRTTHDIDFVVQLAISAVPRIIKEFSGDFFVDEAMVRAAFRPPHQFNAIDTRSALKVDFWLPTSDPFALEMLQRRVQATLFGEAAWLATAEDIILHKLIWNHITPSDRQLGDCAGIIAVQAERLDLGYLNHWANELHLTEDLADLLSGRIRPNQT
jgi:hypothetical protein